MHTGDTPIEPRDPLRVFLDHNPDGVVVHFGGEVLYANPAICAILGYRPEQLLGRNAAEFVHPDDLVAVVERMRLATEQGIAAPPRLERFFCAGGEVRYFEVSNIPITWGSKTCVCVYARHVTERVLAERHREEAHAEAERQVNLRQQLLEVVSHDLRNPLGALRSSLDTLRRALPPGARPAVVDPLLDLAERSTVRMERLIQDLVDMSAIEGGGLSVVPRAEAVASLLEEARDALRDAARVRHLGVQVRLPEGADEDLAVHCDRGRVVQVLVNLGLNAMHFTPTGTDVELGWRHDGGFVRFEVRDHGPGVRPDELPFLFDKHFRGDGAAPQGAGLGLFIARGIVLAHGGSIGTEPAPGGGSVFWCTFARAASAQR